MDTRELCLRPDGGDGGGEWTRAGKPDRIGDGSGESEAERGEGGEGGGNAKVAFIGGCLYFLRGLPWSGEKKIFGA